MPTICRLFQLSSEDAAALIASPASLATRVSLSDSHADVYRYWHAIEYLLAAQRPGGSAAQWLRLGTPITAAEGDVPGARVLSADEVRALDAELRDIEPDRLYAHYSAAALDDAKVYPATWQEWEEDFDPAGQVLEHYSFLQMFTAQCVKKGCGALLYFDVLPEGSV